MQRGKVMVVGSANMDLVVRTARFALPGETILGDSFATFPGGKGANQAVAAGKLEGAVRFVGKVGADTFGDSLESSLREAGVDTTNLLRDRIAPTGIAAIAVDASGQNSIVVVQGANGNLAPEEVERALVSERPSVVLTQLETPMDTLCALPPMLPAGTFFVLNPAPARAVPAEVLSRVDLLTPNESEAETLTGIRPGDDASCLAAAAKLLDLGVKSVVFTLGAKGSFYADRDGGRHFPTINVKAVDTTAAGDAFNGALATFLAEGREVANAIPLANCVGALSATKAGAQASMPTRAALAEVADRLL